MLSKFKCLWNLSFTSRENGFPDEDRISGLSCLVTKNETNYAVRNHLGACLCALSLNQLKWKKFSPEFRTLANQNGPILPDFRRIFITSHSERPNVSHKVTYSMLSRLLNSLKNCCMRTRRNRCSILKNDRTSSFLPVGAAKAKTSTGKEATRSNGNSPLA